METILKTIEVYARTGSRYKLWLFLNIFLSSLGIIFGSILVPLMASKGINALAEFSINGSDFWATFGMIITLYIVFQLISWSMWRLGAVCEIKFVVPSLRDLNQKVFNHLTTMSYRFFANSFGGSLVAQANRFVYSFERLYDVFIYDVLGITIRLVFASIVLFTFVPGIAIGLIVWSALYIASSIFLSIKKLPLSKKTAKRQSETTARLADNLTNMSNIKYFAREKYEIKQFNKITQKLATAANWDWGVAQLIFTWQGFLSMLFEIFIFCISLYLVANQKINLGQLVLIQLYIGIVINNLWRVPQIVRNTERAIADSTEMTEILNTEPEIKDVSDPLKCQIKDGLIEFKDVTFDHLDSEGGDPLFENLTFTIKPGEKVGLAGPSGGGKTTLTKLILRMSDISKGTISIDGQDISKLKQTDLRDCITYVPQEPILFHRSLLENISYGNPSAALDDCVGSAIQANADKFISKLKDGYDTLVGERGIKLSGGQRQRVAIARSMLKDAPILLLDEATSALDSGSEKLIQDALWKLMQDRTALVIAHRLSTIQKLDRILVIDNGRIAEEGTHKDLLDKNGIYAKLWAHQSGGFIK